MAATDVIDKYLGSLPGQTRKLGDSQWGVTIEPAEDGGWPLDLGLRLKEGCSPSRPTRYRPGGHRALAAAALEPADAHGALRLHARR